MSMTESADNLVEKGVEKPPANGVRVDVKYDIRRHSRKSGDDYSDP